MPYTPTAIRTKLSDAIVTYINASTAFDDLDFEFTAERKYLPYYELAEEDGLKVVVVNRKTKQEKVLRSTIDNTVIMDVAVQKAVLDDSNGENDPLADFVELLMDVLSDIDMGDEEGNLIARWKESANEAIYEPDYLEKRIYTSIISVTYIYSSAIKRA